MWDPCRQERTAAPPRVPAGQTAAARPCPHPSHLLLVFQRVHGLRQAGRHHHCMVLGCVELLQATSHTHTGGGG
jgi:hypothetical protein